MELSLIILAAALLLVAIATGWCLTLLGLPGNWLMVIATIIYALAVPSQWRTAIGWPAVMIIAALAVAGELMEFAAGALGTSQAGGSKRSAALALAGSVAGGLVGAFVGLPIPVVGTVLGAIVFAACGAMAGAVLGESWKGRNLDEGIAVGKAAFWGRLMGTLGKIFMGSMMVAVVVVALLTG
jgi:uncharacterized protein YqgC (DUF456 family)